MDVVIPQLTIAKGESFGLVGNNGAGKTTFFRLILDLIEANNGYVEIENEKVARNENWKKMLVPFWTKDLLLTI